MTTEKYLKLLSRLEEKTASGQADWQTTANDGVFSLAFSNYSVQIGLKRVYNQDDPDVVISILNSVGDVVDAVRDTELGPESGFELSEFYKRMRRLYDSARRRASGVDEALDSILDDLT